MRKRNRSNKTAPVITAESLPDVIKTILVQTIANNMEPLCKQFPEELVMQSTMTAVAALAAQYWYGSAAVSGVPLDQTKLGLDAAIGTFWGATICDNLSQAEIDQDDATIQ